MSASCTVRGCTYPLSAFHCGKGGCHRTFMYLDEFDLHRAGPVEARICVDPAKVGLVYDEGIWSTERHHEVRQALKSRLAVAREEKSKA